MQEQGSFNLSLPIMRLTCSVTPECITFQPLWSLPGAVDDARDPRPALTKHAQLSFMQPWSCIYSGKNPVAIQANVRRIWTGGLDSWRSGDNLRDILVRIV